MPTSASSSPVPGRQCGDCAMCCKLPKIPILEKPENQWCVHCSTHQCCDIYEDRPAPCRGFFCMYMLNPNLTEEWRPTHARLLVIPQQASGGAQLISVLVDPLRPDAWRKEPYFSTFKLWSANFQVIVTVGKRKIVVFADHEQDLGEVPEGSIIEFIGTPSAQGMRVTAQVRLL